MIIDKYGKITDVLKAEEDWDNEDDKSTLGNFKAFNAIFNGVDKKIFRLINKCILAKYA